MVGRSAFIVAFLAFACGERKASYEGHPGRQAESAIQELIVGDAADGGAVSKPSHRIVRHDIALADGTRFADSTWDYQLDIPCQFQPGKDGVLRCYPFAGLGITRYYLDKDCSQMCVVVCTVDESSPRVVRWLSAEWNLDRRPLAPDEFEYALLGSELVKSPKLVYSKHERCIAESARRYPQPCRFHKLGRRLKNEDFAVGIGYEFDDLTQESP